MFGWIAIVFISMQMVGILFFEGVYHWYGEYKTEGREGNKWHDDWDLSIFTKVKKPNEVNLTK